MSTGISTCVTPALPADDISKVMNAANEEDFRFMLKGVSHAMSAVWQLSYRAAHRNLPNEAEGFANTGACKTVERG